MGFVISLVFILVMLFLAFRALAKDRRGRTFDVGPGAAGTVWTC